MTECIKPWVTRIQQFHRDKVLSGIDDKDLKHPVWGWDNRLLRGQNGIGTLFGRKPNEKDAPLPTVPCRLLIKPGSCEKQQYVWSSLEHSISELGHDQCLAVLYKVCYSVPCATMVGYDPTFLSQIKVKNAHET